MKIFLTVLFIFLGFLIYDSKIWFRYKAPPKIHNPAFREYKIKINQTERRYFVKWPHSSASKDKKNPVMMAFHGGQGQGLNFEGRTRLGEFLEKKDIIYVLPEGYKSFWNDKSGAFREDEEIDDVQFIKEVIKKISEDFPVDPKRIFIAGYSRGGTFSMRLACEINEQLAGVVVVGASMPLSLESQCSFKNPVSLLLIHGEDDPIIPFEGGEIGNQNYPSLITNGNVLGAHQSVELWSRLLKCQNKAEETRLPILVQDGTSVTHISYTNCQAGKEINFYKVKGMGHAWPPRPRSMVFFMGQTSHNVQANELILKFIENLN